MKNLLNLIRNFKEEQELNTPKTKKIKTLSKEPITEYNYARKKNFK
jgi:hypothetical protein